MISDLKIAYSIELETWFSSIVFYVSKQFTKLVNNTSTRYKISRVDKLVVLDYLCGHPIQRFIDI